jgi:hypothetical protein
MLIIIVATSITLFIIIVIIIIIIIIRIYLKKRLKFSKSTSPISEPDIVVQRKKRATNDLLSVPVKPSLEENNSKIETIIFDLKLPKCRGNMLPPLSSRLESKA